jgi:Rod binding domain-containing protein
MNPALPQVSELALPREVRSGSAADKQAYQVAAGFEKVLVGELVKELAKASPALSEGPRAGAVGDAMTDALTNAGGLGLAPELYRTIKGAQR